MQWFKKQFSQLIPHAFISVLILLCWLMLNGFSRGQFCFGFILAIAIPRLTVKFWVPQLQIHRPWRLIWFVVQVFYDITISNFVVARKILTPKVELQPGFIIYPLAIQESFPITLLTSTLSLSPGTLSAHLRLHDNTLLIHALDVKDRQALTHFIYERYERPLKEIFGC